MVFTQHALALCFRVSFFPKPVPTFARHALVLCLSYVIYPITGTHLSVTHSISVLSATAVASVILMLQTGWCKLFDGLARFFVMVGAAGFEPTTLCPPDRCATRLRYAPTGAFRFERDQNREGSKTIVCRVSEPDNRTHLSWKHSSKRPSF